MNLTSVLVRLPRRDGSDTLPLDIRLVASVHLRRTPTDVSTDSRQSQKAAAGVRQTSKSTLLCPTELPSTDPSDDRHVPGDYAGHTTKIYVSVLSTVGDISSPLQHNDHELKPGSEKPIRP